MASRARRAAEPGDPLIFDKGRAVVQGAPVGDADVEIAVGGPEIIDGIGHETTDDGGAIIDWAPKAPMLNRGTDLPHQANLLEVLTDQEQSDIAGKLTEQIDADWESAGEWRDQTAKGIELLGVKIEEKDFPFKGAAAVTDPLMLEALIRYQANASGEMLPSQGPVKAAIIGMAMDETEMQASRVQQFMNYYLTEEAPEFYPNYDQMLFWQGLIGSTFKKVYQDPLLGRPTSPFLTPNNLIVSYNTDEIETCPRITQAIDMYKRDVLTLQKSGIYADVRLPEQSETATNQSSVKIAVDMVEGKTPIIPDNDDRVRLYESHVDLDIPQFAHMIGSEKSGIPIPYRVTVEKETQKLLAVYRNWKEGDPRFRKRNYFVHYKFLPGLGFYGFGLVHMLGQSTKTATTILRQLIDAGTLVSFPGGVRAKGVRMTKNNIRIGPTEFPEVDTGGMPLDQAFKPLPYREPSQQLRELRREVVEDARRVANTSEIAVGDGRQDAPVGTTMALLEAATKVESGIIKRLHRSMRSELRLFAELFGEFLPEAPYPFPVQGGMQAIMRADFSDRIDVTPVSDPNYGSATQRLVKAEARLRMGQQAPQIHDMRELYRDVYMSMNMDPERVNKILPPPQQARPMDPVSENMAAMTGKPVTVGPWQDDEAHIQVHSALAQDPGMAAHISDHMAQAFRKKIEKVLGIPLPPPGMQLPPEIENQIAVLTAKAAEVIKATSGAPGTPMDPAVMALQVEAQARAQDAKAGIEKAMIQASSERYKADLKFQTAMVQTQSRERTERIRAFAAVADNLNPARPEATDLLTRNLQ